MRLKLLLFCIALTASVGCQSENDYEAERARDDCQRACGDLNRGIDVCVSGDLLADCNRACLSVAPTDATSFDDCVHGHFFDDQGDCSKSECLSTLNVSASGPNNAAMNNGMTGGGEVATCKANCEAIEQDCPDETDAGVTGDCKAACDSSTSDSTQSFSSCSGNNRYVCSDLIPCYDHLGVFL